MPIHFNADEVFQMAVQIERNGAEFYRQAAGRASEARTIALMTKLAAMEEDHERTFLAMKAELPETQRTPKEWDPEGEAGLYLQAMADWSVFDQRPGAHKVLTGEENAEELVWKAIGLERDSIDFYVGMKEATPPRWGREKIDEIIRQEVGHIATLRRELAALRQETLA